MFRGRRKRSSVVGVALVALALPTLVLVGATAQPATAEGLRESASTTYVLDPAAGAVHVTVDLTVTNTSQDQFHGNIIERPYYNVLLVGALAEAANFGAVSGGGANLSVTSEAAPVSFAQRLVVHLSSNLFSNQTQVIHLHYDLLGGAPRSKSFTRVTPAFSAFEAWAEGDPGAASVTVVVPKSFTVEVVGDSMTKSATGATVTYSASAIADPSKWLVSVSARDDAKLLGKNLTVDGHAVKIRAFPDDAAWGTFVTGRVSKGLPQLEKLIGLPWPSGKDGLLVTETVTPYLYGYAGWYKRGDNTIEIGDELDPQVILHELSHMWFNDLLFNDRWIDEGLAQEYASRAVAKMGGKLENPKTVNLNDRGSVRLDAWAQLDLQSEISQAQETYGYNASWYVIRRLANEIGLVRMQRVIAAASKYAIPYLGAKNPEAAAGAASWKRFLDYLDETGASKVADNVFVTYVAPVSEHNTLVARTRAREAYAGLVAVGKDWTPPLTLRQAMTNWEFPTAQDLIDGATAVTKVRDTIDRTVRPLGLHSPAKLKTDYEYGVRDLDQVQEEAKSDLVAAQELVTARAAVEGHHGLFAKIGLFGASDRHNLSDARTAFTAGDAADARASAVAAEHVVADASSAGKLRAGVAAGLIVLLVLTFWGLRGLTRRRERRRAAALEAAVEPEPGPQNEEVAPSPAG